MSYKFFLVLPASVFIFPNKSVSLAIFEVMCENCVCTDGGSVVLISVSFCSWGPFWAGLSVGCAEVGGGVC